MSWPLKLPFGKHRLQPVKNYNLLKLALRLEIISKNQDQQRNRMKDIDSHCFLPSTLRPLLKKLTDNLQKASKPPFQESLSV